MKLDDIVNKVFNQAYAKAKKENHEYFTPEHIMHAALFFHEGKEILEACGGDSKRVREELNQFLRENIPQNSQEEPVDTLGVHQIVQITGRHAASSGKNVITLGDIFIAIFDLKESYASYVIQKEGIRRLDMLNFISHGMPSYLKGEDEWLNAEEGYVYNESEHEEVEEALYEEDESAGEESKEKFLEKFVVDITEKAKKGQLDPLIGRSDIIERTIQVLSRRTKNNPVHVGDPGVGKTAITEGLAQRIIEGKVPYSLKKCKIFSIDMGTLLAGTKYRGDFEERIKNVLKILQNMEDAIVFIDEIHTVIGAGAVSGGAMDASNILKPFLTNGKLKFIGSTTFEEYKKYFEKDRALTRRFQKIDIAEPTREDCIQILQGLKPYYEAFHHVKFTDVAIELAVELSAKYIQDRFLPDKAIDVLDETGAFLRMYEEDVNKKLTVREKDIERTVAAMTKIPKKTIATDEIKKLKNLGKTLKSNIFGQDKAVEVVTSCILQQRAGFDDGQKPVASLLFVGPTGVGKTELVKQLALAMGIPLIRLDMSEYQEKHAVARLIGSPPGYVGYEEGGILIDLVRKTPHAVLLLDEIEKAHFDIFNVLLQVMDYATLTDNSGKRADFRNIILVMTSNAGAREVGKRMIGFEERVLDRSAMGQEVQRVFSPEFRNRLDGIVVFEHMDQPMATLVAKRELLKFAVKLQQKNVHLHITEEVYTYLAQRALASEFGAREILRIIQQEIKNYFVEKVLYGDLSKGGGVDLTIVNHQLAYTIHTRKETQKKQMSKKRSTPKSTPKKRTTQKPMP